MCSSRSYFLDEIPCFCVFGLVIDRRAFYIIQFVFGARVNSLIVSTNKFSCMVLKKFECIVDALLLIFDIESAKVAL